MQLRKHLLSLVRLLLSYFKAGVLELRSIVIGHLGVIEKQRIVGTRNRSETIDQEFSGLANDFGSIRMMAYCVVMIILLFKRQLDAQKSTDRQ